MNMKINLEDFCVREGEMVKPQEWIGRNVLLNMAITVG
jgi:hypothetical protein